MQTANETDSTDEIERQPIPIKIKRNETSGEDEKERQAEQAIEQQEAEKNTENNKEDERETQITPTTVPTTSGNQSAPIQGTVEWEKRASSRVTKKPDSLVNTIMISKIEATSGHLPSVYEIAKPKQTLPENNETFQTIELLKSAVRVVSQLL